MGEVTMNSVTMARKMNGEEIPILADLNVPANMNYVVETDTDLLDFQNQKEVNLFIKNNKFVAVYEREPYNGWIERKVKDGKIVRELPKDGWRYKHKYVRDNQPFNLKEGEKRKDTLQGDYATILKARRDMSKEEILKLRSREQTMTLYFVNEKGEICTFQSTMGQIIGDD